VLDMTGLAQKGGAVLSHVRIAKTPEEIHAVRIAAGEARLVLGCDLVVAAGDEAVSKMKAGLTRAIVNAHETTTGDFTRHPDLHFPGAELKAQVADAVGRDAAEFIEGTRLATALMGDSIATNLFMLGFAWQRGLVPVSAEAIAKAIELNAVAVDANKRAFAWGRLAAVDPDAAERAAKPSVPPAEPLSDSLDAVIARRSADLVAYQNEAYAARYRALVARIAEAEKTRGMGFTGLTEAVARYYYKLLAIKDEYEVARLYTDGAFHKALAAQFEGDYKLRFNLAPPLIAERDPDNGHLIKRDFGPWMFKAFGLLAKLKFLRGTAIDPFGYTTERKRERALIAEYEALIGELVDKLSPENHALAVEVAELPEHIRGYGHIKDASIARAKKREAELLAMLRTPAPSASAAE
jgi:indolepyruvate ferredoxin oxidoreductase